MGKPKGTVMKKPLHENFGLVVTLIFGVILLSAPVWGWDDLGEYKYDDSGWNASRGTWFDMANAPNVGAYGEALIGTGDHIYVIRCATATSTPYHWRYNPSSDTWSTMSISGLSNGVFRNGSAMAWDQADDIFVLAGARYSDNSRQEYYSYSISGDSWTTETDTPFDQGAGDAMVWSPYDNYVYALIGSSAHGTGFARYNPSNGNWSILNPPPAGIDDGCSLAWTGSHYLFAIRGEYYESSPLTDFWRYDIDTGAWITRSNIPDAGGVGDGGSMIWIGDFIPDQSNYLYALSGGAYNEVPGYDFWRYYIPTDTWTQIEDLLYPVGYYNGCRIGCAVDDTAINYQIYCYQGSRSDYFGGGDTLAMYELSTIPTPTPDPAGTPTPTPTTICPDNLVTNAGYEDWIVYGSPGPPDYWEEGTGVFTATRESGTVYDGTYATNLTWTSTTTQQFEQQFVVSPNETYDIRLKVYDNDAAGRIRLYCYWQDNTGTNISSLYSSYTLDSTAWQSIEILNQVAPANAYFFLFRISMYDVGAPWTQAVAYVDNAECCGVIPPATPTPTPAPTVSIYDIQYTLSAPADSPYDGQIVRTRGVVTAAQYGNNQIFIQDGAGAWNGIKLYNPGVDLEQGDLVEVQAMVDEYFNMTELYPVYSVQVLGVSNPLPAAEVLTTLATAQEQWESVLVRTEDVTVTNINPDDPSDYGEWEIDNATSPIRVDDVYYLYEPTLSEFLDYVQGPLNYGYSNFKILPRDNNDISSVASATSTPTAIPTVTPTTVPTFTPGPTSTPTFTPAPTSTPTMTPTHTATTTPVDTPTPTPVCVHHGDVNLSGSITAGDAQMAFEIALELISVSPEQECAADCNNTGNVTAGDAQAIFNAALELDTCADPL